jgi:hypothetical protein
VLSPLATTELIKKKLFKEWEQERDRLDRIDHWYRWTQEDIHLPRAATLELKRLTQLSKVPWLGLVVTSAAQAMYVDGYRSRLDNDGDLTDSPPWRTWLANGMDRRQTAVHRYGLAYGYSFLTVLPGEDPLTGQSQAVMRGVSPRKMYAVWDDPAEDDWPEYALRIVERSGDDHLARLYDSTAVHTLRISGDGEATYLDEPQIHDAGVCPVVRYANMLDLDGRTPGEVEPYIALAARINKTSYDRMLVQHFNSWKVRYITGMSPPDDDETANRAKLQLRQDDLLIAEHTDAKFGTLDETELGGFIAAHRADVETLAAASQTPTHELTGQMANLSAEALAAARASLNQKVTERQKSFGASHAQALRLAAALEGHDEYARDITGRVTWQDMEIRSMSQAADALGKMVQMLHVPPSATWARIPGVEKSDVQEWVALAERGDPITQLQMRLEQQSAEIQADAQAEARAEVEAELPQPAPDGGQRNGRPVR